MSDYLRLAIIFAAAVNPAAAALSLYVWRSAPPSDRWRAAALGAAAAAALLALACALADRLLEALDVEPETFRIAAGIVMVTAGVQAVWRPGREPGDTPPAWRSALFPLAVPLLAGPAALAASLTYAADEGAAMAIGAALPAVALAVLLVAFPPRGVRLALAGVAVVTGALLVAVAAGLIVSGVRDI